MYVHVYPRPCEGNPKVDGYQSARQILDFIYMGHKKSLDIDEWPTASTTSGLTPETHWGGGEQIPT